MAVLDVLKQIFGGENPRTQADALTEIRRRYPQYASVPDDVLAVAAAKRLPDEFGFLSKYNPTSAIPPEQTPETFRDERFYRAHPDIGTQDALKTIESVKAQYPSTRSLEAKKLAAGLEYTFPDRFEGLYSRLVGTTETPEDFDELPVAKIIKDAPVVGLNQFNATLARTPNYAYNLAAWPLNTALKAAGYQPIKDPRLFESSAQWWERNARAMDHASRIWDEKGETFETILGRGDAEEISKYVAYRTLQNAPQLGLTIAATLAGAPGAGLTILGTQAAVQSYEENRELMAADPNASGKVMMNSVLSGAIEAATERLGTVSIVQQMSKRLTQTAGKQGAAKIMANAFRMMFRFAPQEASEEAIASLGTDFSKVATGVDPNAMKGAAGRMLESAAVGAATAGLFAAGGGIAGGVARVSPAERPPAPEPVRVERPPVSPEAVREAVFEPTPAPVREAPPAPAHLLPAPLAPAPAETVLPPAAPTARIPAPAEPTREAVAAPPGPPPAPPLPIETPAERPPAKPRRRGFLRDDKAAEELRAQGYSEVTIEHAKILRDQAVRDYEEKRAEKREGPTIIGPMGIAENLLEDIESSGIKVPPKVSGGIYEEYDRSVPLRHRRRRTGTAPTVDEYASKYRMSESDVLRIISEEGRRRLPKRPTRDIRDYAEDAVREAEREEESLQAHLEQRGITREQYENEIIEKEKKYQEQKDLQIGEDDIPFRAVPNAQKALRDLAETNRVTDEILIRAVTSIAVTSDAEKASLREGHRLTSEEAKVYGSFQSVVNHPTVKAVITLADGADAVTGAHEFMHFAKQNLLDESRNRILEEQYGAGREGEERQAEAFGKFYADGVSTNNARVDGVFRRLGEFLRKVKNYFRGLGFESPRSIFEGLRIGRFARPVAARETGVLPRAPAPPAAPAVPGQRAPTPPAPAGPPVPVPTTIPPTPEGRISPPSPEAARASVPGDAFPSLAGSFAESISQHPDFVKLTNDVNAVVRHHAGQRGVQPSLRFAENLWREMHDILGKWRLAKPDTRPAILAEMQVRFPDIEKEFAAMSDKFILHQDSTGQYSAMVNEVFQRRIAGKYLESMRPKAGLDAEKPPEAPLFRATGPAVEPFYSRLEQRIAEKMPNRAPIGQIRNIVSEGVKREEIEWTGLAEWLGKQEGTIEKSAVLDFVRSHRVIVQDVTKAARRPRRTYAELQPEIDMNMEAGRRAQARGQREEAERFFRAGERLTLEAEGAELAGPIGEDPTKFGKWVLPGGKNYTELLITLPRAELAVAFRGPHFEEPNVLAHVRFNERTDAEGKRVLFIEEIQSDWHQKGRERGYDTGSISELPKGTKAYAPGDEIPSSSGRGYPAAENVWTVLIPYAVHGRNLFYGVTRDEAEGNARQFIARPSLNAVPDAPFKKTWHELAMKRMLRWAAESGYDRVAWTTGRQQADRYDLSKQVGQLGATKQVDGKFRLNVMNPDGERILYREDLSRQDVEDLIGKDIADKIAGQESGQMKVYRGEDLRVGGEGMVAFYDRIIPSFMRGYVGKWGSEVRPIELVQRRRVSYLPRVRPGEEITVPLMRGGRLPRRTVTDRMTVSGVDVTDDMRHSVLEVGQPLFRAKNLRENALSDIKEIIGNKKISRVELGRILAERNIRADLSRMRSSELITVREILRSVPEVEFTESERALANRLRVGIAKLRKEYGMGNKEFIDLAMEVAGVSTTVRMTIPKLTAMKERLTALTGLKSEFESFKRQGTRLRTAELRKEYDAAVEAGNWDQAAHILETHVVSLPVGQSVEVRGLADAAKRFWRDWGTSGVTILRRMGPSGTRMAAGLNRLRRESSMLSGGYEAALEKVDLAGTSKPERVRLLNALEGRTSVADNPRLQAIYDVIRSAQVDFAKRAVDMRIAVRGEDGSLHYFAPRNNYFTHTIPPLATLKDENLPVRQDVIDNLVNIGIAKNVGDARNTLDLYIRYVESNGGDERFLHKWVNLGKAATVAEARDVIDRFVMAYTTRKLGSLEYSRDVELPFYDPDPARVIPGWIENTSRRLKQIEIFGQRNELAFGLLDDIGNEGGSVKLAKRIYDSATERLQYDPEERQIQRWFQDFVIITKMGFSFLLQPTTAANTAAFTDGTSLLNGMVRAMTAGGKEFALRSGAISSVTLREAAKMGSRISGRGEAFLRGAFLIPFDRFMRAWAANSGRHYALDTFEKLKSDPASEALGAELLRVVPSLRLNDALERGHLTEDELFEAGNTVSTVTQFNVTPENLPPEWRGKPYIEMALFLKSFAFSQTRFAMNEVFSFKPIRAEAKQVTGPMLEELQMRAERSGSMESFLDGIENDFELELKPSAAARVYRMVLFLIAAGLVSEGVNDVKALIYGRDRESRLFKRWIIDNLLMTGMFGFIGDVVQQASFGEKGIAAWVIGPVYSDMVKAVYGIYSITQGKVKPSLRQLYEATPYAAGRFAPAVAMAVRATSRRVFGRHDNLVGFGKIEDETRARVSEIRRDPKKATQAEKTALREKARLVRIIKRDRRAMSKIKNEQAREALRRRIENNWRSLRSMQ